MSWGAALGGIASGVLSYIGQKDTNAAQAQQAQNQMDFQERMRANQYQTTVADLKAAGLNPMLAYTQGGAGNLQGAQAQIGNPLGEAANSAKEGAMAVGQLAQLKVQNYATEMQGEQSYTQAQKNIDDAALSRENAENVRQQTTSEILRQAGLKLSKEQAEAQINQMNSSARLSRATSAYTEATQPEAVATGKAYEDMPNLKKGERVVQAVSAGVNSAKNLRDMARPTPSRTTNFNKTYNYGVR
jgi:hypothetical protein